MMTMRMMMTSGDVDDIDSDATLTIDDNIEDVEGQEDEDQSADVG